MRFVRVVFLLSAFPIFLLLQGCTHGMVKKMAGSGLNSFGNEYVMPWFLSSDDTDVMCSMGEGMGAMAFPLTPNADPMIPLLTLASGMCADERSKEEELRYLRSVRKNDMESAQDARTMQKRWAELAAKRQYFGYQALVRHFGEPGGACPKLEDRSQKMSYLFGLMGGLQAFQLDLANGGAVGIPLDTMPKVLKGLECVNSDELWGIPAAINASVAIMKAKSGGDDKEALSKGLNDLKTAAEFGKSKRVRIVQLMEATVYMAMGDEEKTKQVIRDHIAAKNQTPADPELKLLDEMATRGLRLISDKLWTKATGQRTPYNELGSFWDDRRESSGLDINQLL